MYINLTAPKKKTENELKGRFGLVAQEKKLC
jgi:hypothetical protein